MPASMLGFLVNINWSTYIALQAQSIWWQDRLWYKSRNRYDFGLDLNMPIELALLTKYNSEFKNCQSCNGKQFFPKLGLHPQNNKYVPSCRIKSITVHRSWWVHTRFGKVVWSQSMLCLVRKKGTLEDDLLWDMQPVKPVMYKVTHMVKAPIDKTCCDVKYWLHTVGEICSGSIQKTVTIINLWNSTAIHELKSNQYRKCQTISLNSRLLRHHPVK